MHLTNGVSGLRPDINKHRRNSCLIFLKENIGCNVVGGDAGNPLKRLKCLKSSASGQPSECASGSLSPAPSTDAAFSPEAVPMKDEKYDDSCGP